MRRKGHPSFPSAITCCFFSSLKTLLIPREPIKAPLGVNVPGSSLAGFQVTLFGRIWATPEARARRKLQLVLAVLGKRGNGGVVWDSGPGCTILLLGRHSKEAQRPAG